MIKFGTSGWRGIIAEDFTFRNVRIAVQAIADYLKEKNGERITVGYDTRFLSEDFAKNASEILAGNGLKVFLSKEDVPTPVVAFETVKSRSDGAVNFTASHNDYQYNGLKFSSLTGGPALPEETKRIEELASMNIEGDFKEKKFEQCLKEGLINFYESSDYLSGLSRLVDFEAIRKERKKIAYEAFFGTGRNYIPRLLENITDFVMINGYRDPLFGKMHPEPIEQNLKNLSQKVIEERAFLGIATDGDADRFGAVDGNGIYFSPNKILAIIYKYLLTVRNMKGNVSRTVSTTTLLDRIAKKHGYLAIETPVGFKYIGDTLVRGEAIFGGEESGGASISGWLAEKDGILISSLLVEIVSITGKPLTKLYEEIIKEFGEIYTERLDFDFKGEREAVEEKLREKAKDLIKFSKISSFNEYDGLKFILGNDDWFLFRFSGTEPKVRIYLEATTKEKLTELGEFARATLFETADDKDEV